MIDQLGLNDSATTITLPTNCALVTVQNQSVGALFQYYENTSGASNTINIAANVLYVVFNRVSGNFNTRCLCLLTTSTPPLFIDDSNRTDGEPCWFMIGGTAVNLTGLYATLLDKTI